MRLLDALLEEGTSNYLVLCYSIFEISEIDEAHKFMACNYPREVHYKLCGDQWPYAILLSEARQNEFSDALLLAINLMRKSFDAGKCKSAVCMLDGAFYDYNDLFSEAIAEQIYAFCIKPNEPVIAMSDIVRSSEDWRSIIGKQRYQIT